MRLTADRTQIADLLWKVVMISLVVFVAAYAVAEQVVFPNQRIIKVTILFLLFVIMLRLDTVYSLYLFVLLMPFPSGIALTSTNVVLMTLIPLLWVIRARSVGQALAPRTKLNGAIAFFLIAYMVAFTHTPSNSALIMNLKMLWRQLTAVAFFYLIVTFVDNEQKLSRITKLYALAAGLVGLTAVFELFAPGSTLIPGWINAGRHEFGQIGQRVEGIRTGGAVGSHSLLGDFLSLSLFYVGVHFLRARNPIESTLWVVVFGVSFAAVLSTANRGAAAALVVGFAYALWVFRRYLNAASLMIIVAAAAAIVVGGEIVLEKYTYAVSVTQRLMDTTFEGGVPNNRGGAWIPALKGSLEHVFVGHGPWYDIGIGLEAKAWPHNAYIFNLYTLGLLGLSAFLLVRYKLFRISWDHIRRDPPRRGCTPAANMMGVLHVQFVMHLLHMGRTDFERPGDNVYIFLAWMLYGLIVATGRILDREEREATVAEAPR